PALIQRHRLHGWPFLARKQALDDLAFPHCRKIVGGRPLARRELLSKMGIALLQRLERRLTVLIEVDGDAGEMEEATLDEQVPVPIIGYALIFDDLAWREAADPVRAGAEKRRHSRGLEVDGAEICLGDDRHLHNGESILR